MAATAKSKRLRAGELRTERRVSIKVHGSDGDRELWRGANDQVKGLAMREPYWPPERLANHILRHPDPEAYSRANSNAAELANRFGGTPRGIILEQCEFWHGYQELPYSNPWLNFALLYFGRGFDLEEAADLSGLEIESCRILAFRVGGHYSYRKVARAAGAGVGRSMARDHWLKFIEVIKCHPCHCDNPHCSMSKPEVRKRLAKMIKRDYDAYRRPGVSGSGSAKVGESVAGGDWAGAYGPYPYSVVNGTSKVLDHRLAWIRHYGRIPSEHEVHHVDGNTRNNATGNLAMVPRWLHRILH